MRLNVFYRVILWTVSCQVLCQLSFWLLLRQTLMERREKMKEDEPLSDVKVEEQKKGVHLFQHCILNKVTDDYIYILFLFLYCFHISVWFVDEENEEEESDENDLMQVMGKLVMALLVKYWIYICGGMFFFVSFEGKMVMYKIVYMMMFLFCVALYQVLLFDEFCVLRPVNHFKRVVLTVVSIFSGSLWILAQDLKVFLDVRGGLHHASAHPDLHLSVWERHWKLVENDEDFNRSVSFGEFWVLTYMRVSDVLKTV